MTVTAIKNIQFPIRIFHRHIDTGITPQRVVLESQSCHYHHYHDDRVRIRILQLHLPPLPLPYNMMMMMMMMLRSSPNTTWTNTLTTPRPMESGYNALLHHRIHHHHIINNPINIRIFVSNHLLWYPIPRRHGIHHPRRPPPVSVYCAMSVRSLIGIYIGRHPYYTEPFIVNYNYYSLCHHQ